MSYPAVEVRLMLEVMMKSASEMITITITISEGERLPRTWWDESSCGCEEI